jgi:hypothetical protein
VGDHYDHIWLSGLSRVLFYSAIEVHESAYSLLYLRANVSCDLVLKSLVMLYDIR